MRLFRALFAALRNHPYHTAILLLVVGWIVGVRVYNVVTLEKGYARIAGLLESVEELKSGNTVKELYDAKYFAAMSAEVYRLSHIKGSKTEAPACDLGKILADWRPLPPSDRFPQKPDGVEGDQVGWDGQLVYGVWYRKVDPQKLQVALVFRGTYTFGDWWSNVRWFTKHLGAGWDQYDLAQTVADYVADDLINDHPELQGFATTEFIAAGHSLGGGQAQQAGYANPKYDRVYSFNGSSVTGFYDLDKTERDENKQGLRIYRISERGEVLALLRGFMKTIYPVVEKNPKIVEATYNYGERGLISQHSIDDLACSLNGEE